MKFYAFDPTCHATRTRLGRTEFWKHRLSISVTYSPFLFFSSYFFFQKSQFFILSCGNILLCSSRLFYPLSPFTTPFFVESWKPEVEFVLVSVDIAWLDGVLGFEKLFPLRHCHMCFSSSLMSRNESLVALLGCCHETLKEFLRM